MDSFIFLFIAVVIISAILSFVIGHPELLMFILLFYFVRRIMAPRRRIRHYYYYTTGDDDENTRNENQYTQQTNESIGHNTRADVRPPKHGAIDVEYTEVEEEDLPE